MKPFKIESRGIYFENHDHFGLDFKDIPKLSVEVIKEIERLLNLAYEQGYKKGYHSHPPIKGEMST